MLRLPVSMVRKLAAGVILVTTKRGNDTGKINLKYNAEFGWEIPTKQPSMVGVTRYLEMSNELKYNDNPTGGFFQEYTADKTKNWVKYNATDPNNYPITDWTDSDFEVKCSPYDSYSLCIRR